MNRLFSNQQAGVPLEELHGFEFETLPEPRGNERMFEGERKPKQQQSPRQPVSERFPALEEQKVVFTLLAPEASNVFVAGEFNRWCVGATPLANTGLGVWIADVMLRSGTYEYRFVVDGQWIEDPEESHHVPNSYGMFNSVLDVPLSARVSML